MSDLTLAAPLVPFAPLQLIRGMDKTVEHLVGELKKLAQDVTDEELKDVATVSAGGNDKVCCACCAVPGEVSRARAATLCSGPTSCSTRCALPQHRLRFRRCNALPAPQIGQLISDAMQRVGRAGVVTMEVRMRIFFTRSLGVS